MSSYQRSVDYYSVLGVSRDASAKDINMAFKRLALKLHPDKSGGDRASVEQFYLTQEAVEALRDPERRRRYDESLSRHSFNINQENNGRSRYDGSCGSPGKHRQSETNNGSDRNPFKPQFTSRAPPSEHRASHWSNQSERDSTKPHYTGRGVPNEHSSGESAKTSDQPPCQQRYKSSLNMWGPFIHAYTTHQPRPFLKASMTTHPPKPTGESKDESKPQPTAVESDTRKTPAELQPNETQTPTMQDQLAEENVEIASTSGELLDSDDDSFFHDSTDYESLPDDHLSGRRHSWVATGYDSSPEETVVSLASEVSEASDQQEREDDTMNTMYYDCSENLEHGSNEVFASSTNAKSVDDKAEEKVDEEADEDTDDETETDKIFKTWMEKIDQGQEDLDGVAKSLRGFVPYFDGKLLNAQGRYTTDDMLGEMRGLFLEPYRGWIEAARLRIPGVNDSYNSTDPELCEHMGLWAKTYGCPECQFCKLWKPMYVLTCPTCGKQACIRCKFSSPSTGAETNEAGEEAH